MNINKITRILTTFTICLSVYMTISMIDSTLAAPPPPPTSEYLILNENNKECSSYFTYDADNNAQLPTGWKIYKAAANQTIDTPFGICKHVDPNTCCKELGLTYVEQKITPTIQKQTNYRSTADNTSHFNIFNNIFTAVLFIVRDIHGYFTDPRNPGLTLLVAFGTVTICIGVVAYSLILLIKISNKK